MHLRDRGRGERGVLEAREHFGERPAVGALQTRARHRGRERRHPVLQLRELIGDVRRQQVATGRDRLAELDENRAQLDQRQAQVRPARAGAAARRPDPRGQQQQQAQRPVQMRGPHQLIEPMPQQHPLDAHQAHKDPQPHDRCAFEPLREMRQARLEAIDVIAQGVDPVQQLATFGSGHQVPAFVGQVLGDVAARWCAPRAHRSPAAARASRPR